MLAFLATFEDPTLWQRFLSLRQNNLLSSWKTAIVNITGNSIHNAVVVPLQQPVSGVIDAGLTFAGNKLFGMTLKRDRFMRSILGIEAGLQELGAAGRNAWRMALRGESTYDNILATSGKFDLPDSHLPIPRIITKPEWKGRGRKASEKADYFLSAPSRVFVRAPDEFQKSLSYPINQRVLAYEELLKRNPNLSYAELRDKGIALVNSRASAEEIIAMRMAGNEAGAAQAELANEIANKAAHKTVKDVFQDPFDKVSNALLALRDQPGATPLGQIVTKPMQLLFAFLRTPVQLGARGFELFPPPRRDE